MGKVVKADGQKYYGTKVLSFIKRIKNQINRNIEKKRYETAIKLISVLSNLLYQTNQYFVDEDLEKVTLLLTDKLFGKTVINNVSAKTVLFYDGFGLENRGLAYIYIKGLCKNGYRVVYIVEKSSEQYLTRTLNLLSQHDAEVFFIENEKFIEKSAFLRNIIIDTCPNSLFIYTKPHDVSALMAFESIQGDTKKFLINLTDHAFWLGNKSFDYIIEFRDYGASISFYRRQIEKEKIIKLPFYPEINHDIEFEGYPFEFDDKQQKFFFSGGAIYKTFGDNDRYYKLVERILNKYNNLIFWYAGSGDASKLQALKNKFNDRVFITQERKDLYQILRRCFFYLSTYPICGGLMFQYSAAAQRLPLTLYHDEISSDFLIDQSCLGVEFKDENLLLNELDQLFSDVNYLEAKQNTIIGSIIKEDEFNKELDNLIKNIHTHYDISYKTYDINQLTDTYLKNINFKFIANTLADKNLAIGLKYYPKYFLAGCAIKIKKKMLRRIK